jgi:hypothetical protein
MDGSEGGSRIKSGMTQRTPRWTSNDPSGRVQPAWVRYFLRALERTGDVRASAEDAGIDHSTAYARRRAHPEFAAAWENALRLRSGRAEEEKAAELEALEKAPSPGSPFDKLRTSPPRPAKGRGAVEEEELVGADSQLKQAGEGRWNRRKEKLFFEELAATANVKRAAKAAGVSPNAVYQRRMRDAHFKAKWAAVLETGRASIEMHLVEAANRSFEPDELDVGNAEPRVSVAEAIRIVQVHGSRKQQEELANPFAEQAASMGEQEVEELRERVFRKLKRLLDRDRRDKLQEGWALDEKYDCIVPPGWVRA